MFVAKPVANSLFTLITLGYLLEGHVAGAHYHRTDEMTRRRSLRRVDSSAAPEVVAANEMDFLLAETASFWGRNLNGSGSGGKGKGKGGRGKGGGGQVRLVPIRLLRLCQYVLSQCNMSNVPVIVSCLLPCCNSHFWCMTFQYLFDFSILQLYFRRDLEKAREERPAKESRVDRESTSPMLILIVASDQMTQASGHESQKKRIGKRKTIAKTPLLSSTTPAFPLLLPMIFSFHICVRFDFRIPFFRSLHYELSFKGLEKCFAAYPGPYVRRDESDDA